MSDHNERQEVEIRPLALPSFGLHDLADEALADGHRFVDRLVNEWSSGENRFDGQGEVLLAALSDRQLLGIGGLNQDPYTRQPRTGRIRHFYVREPVRRKGVGHKLLNALIDQATAFDRLRLFTESDEAAEFYERVGFARINEHKATHALKL